MSRSIANRSLRTRAQSMAELAVFGSLLLMVLGMLVKYGMSYNARQQLKMDTFRKALLNAYNDQHGEQLVVFKDHATAEPSDEWGTDARAVESASDYVVWTFDQAPDSPSIKYTFIGLNGEHSKTYTTEGTMTMSPSEVTIYYPSGPVTYPASRMKPSPEGMLQLLGGGEDCQASYCPSDTVGRADVDNDGNEETIIKVTGTTGAVTITFKDPKGGDIDTGAGAENPLERQGPQWAGMKYDKRDTLKMNAGSNSQRSIDETTENMFRIKTNHGDEETSIVSHETK